MPNIWREKNLPTTAAVSDSQPGGTGVGNAITNLFPHKKPLAPGHYSIQKKGGQNKGSLANWRPGQYFTRGQEARDREAIVERVMDLAANDANVAGPIASIATAVVGPGLVPNPSIDHELLGITRDEARLIQKQQKAAFDAWTPYADLTGRLDFGALQFLAQRNLVQHGETFILMHMDADPIRPYSLALNIIHPLRVKTPTDLYNDDSIKDGIEIKNSKPSAYWIKKAGTTSDVSINFVRIPARIGHRHLVLHIFNQDDAEQIRGVSHFAPAIKQLRDLSDFVDAELVSNVVTAAFALFIETPNPDAALGYNTYAEPTANGNGDAVDESIQEVSPGSVLYGQKGQRPHSIDTNRPSGAFDPFVKAILKAVSVSLNIPYPVLYKDIDGVSFAGFRSAMLEAWRTYSYMRSQLAAQLSKIYTMLLEESYLRGDFKAPDFYSKKHIYTKADWRGPPKGDIEPIKAVKADLMAIAGNIKTREQAIAERGGNYRAVFEKLEEEIQVLKEKGLTTEVTDPERNLGNKKEADEKPDKDVDDDK